MRVSDIWEEVKSVLGSCDDPANYRKLTRAVQLLANKGLFDPLLGTIDFTADGAYYLALPRDVKTPIRLNINNNPAFARGRLFEFQPNTDGSVDEAEVGWQWAEKGYSPIQDERKLPSKVRYGITDPADEGKTMRVIGIDVNGREQDVTLIGLQADPVPSEPAFGEIRKIIRQPTTAEAWLYAETGAIGRYYPDEEQPEYRVIKISKTGVAIRMIYRKHVFKITSQEDIIPLHSEFAVIRAVEAVKEWRKDPEKARGLLEDAVKMIKEEQGSRDDGTESAMSLEIQTAINANTNTLEGLIVADIYDEASNIFGNIGRQKLFDRITDAIEALQNKSQWESVLGFADIYRSANWDDGVKRTLKRGGVYVLPRFVDAVLALNTRGRPGMPRNRWYQFHLNGSGETKWASCGAWDELGDTCIINQLPIDKNRKTIPVKLVAIPNSALDDDTEIVIYGIEQLADGRHVEVWRDGTPGWICPCKYAGSTTDDTYPNFVQIDRIKKDASTDFIRLFTASGTDGVDFATDLLLGYYYPDELEPRYRMIRTSGCSADRITIRYRKRTHKVTSLHDPINLRSRLALENMFRAMEKQKEDPRAAVDFESLAESYIIDEQAARNPISAGGLQFNTATMPGHTQNIQ